MRVWTCGAYSGIDVMENLDTIYDFDVLHYEMTSNAEIKAHVDRVGIEIMR